MAQYTSSMVEIIYTGKDGKRMKKICGLWSEGHEMKGVKRPSCVCPGDTCDPIRGKSGLQKEEWLQDGFIEAAKGKQKRLTRPINFPIVATRITQEGAALWLCTR